MHYQEIKATVLRSSINKLCDTATEKFGIFWSLNPSFHSSRERVLMGRYIEQLHILNETPHQVTDLICPE